MLHEGEQRYSSGTTPTKYTYTGQYSHVGDFGLMFYNARWYDAALGRFAQADTIVPDGVQGYDRYAYVSNNPTGMIDPSGHRNCEEDGYGCWDGTDKGERESDSKRNDQHYKGVHLGNSSCTSDSCRAWASSFGMIGFALDSFSFGWNAFAFLVVYGGGLIDPVAGGVLEVAYKQTSFIPNTMGTLGGTMWTIQGFVTGETQFDAGFSYTSGAQPSLNSVHYSATVSQDTYASAILDGAGWATPEPFSASFVSGVGVAYDLFRGPISPAVPSSEYLPPIIHPRISMNYNFQTGTGSIDGSLLAP